MNFRLLPGWVACLLFGSMLAGTAAAQSSESTNAGTGASTAASGDTSATARAETESPAASTRRARAMDRLELDTTQVTGNRELPTVMVVVPWKKSDIGDPAGKPSNSLVDEALQPVDREVFRREVDYYGALAPDRPDARAPSSAAAGSTVHRDGDDEFAERRKAR
jgi:hypothetical protein